MLCYSFIIQTLASPPRWRRHGAKHRDWSRLLARADEVIE